jgi:hypothetical protein
MFGPIFCNKNPTICISLELLNKVVSLSLPHLLAYSSSPLGQLEVDKDIVPGEVVSSCHAFREQVPGRPCLFGCAVDILTLLNGKERSYTINIF